MPFILRKIRKSRWYNENLPWLSAGDTQADSLGDLQTKDNSLSVWYIDDDQSNLRRVITALAATADNISTFDYAIFHERLVSVLNLRIIQSEGNTPDAEANSSWHRDLVELSGSKLARLARMISEDAEKRRVLGREVRSLIEQAVLSGQLNAERLKENVRTKTNSRR